MGSDYHMHPPHEEGCTCKKCFEKLKRQIENLLAEKN